MMIGYQLMKVKNLLNQLLSAYKVHFSPNIQDFKPAKDNLIIFFYKYPLMKTLIANHSNPTQQNPSTVLQICKFESRSFCLPN